jgi:predicted RNase H-like nuclease (RuvC/YqgF family)
MGELNERRSKMTKLSEESGHNRDSLLAANAQVVNLKAQLDRAVEKKVNKKLLKVSFEFLLLRIETEADTM